ncbi:proteasome-activating nucleotidase [Candidatus Methanoperedens nitratireducens]|uniref:Proteasome-activating nucleotidase 1 n=1 Tax=Candidatus Methanoperedens nitratireducens TaxID=1392998 RepID=A0A284VSK9_9EURY|nr:proteasome-activating nucleotidase [Candidatus Methanoperedens nitroreducens]SNQ62173.1 Proteasome-activating nucleotidase 1 [Candidatus Methanoperedens nitroreducens]
MEEAIAKNPAADSTIQKDSGTEIKELREMVESLRDQVKEMHSRLLEAAILNNKYVQTIQEYQKQIEQLKKPPLFICSVVELLDDMALLRQHGSNQEIVTWVPDEIKTKIEAGARVAVTNNLAIVRVLSKSADVRARVMELIEAPDVDYNMIGGLNRQIDEVIEVLELPLTNPELFAEVGVEPPNGILLYGPPGTGKTLIAKAVAHRAKATFIRMSGTELVQKYIGEGARLVRDVFDIAREKSPSIVFIDEIDAVGSRRSYDGTTGSSEVNRTMVQLLAELDGFDKRGDVKVVAATNRIDLLDPALLRPGRFDRIIEVPRPDAEGRLEILKIHSRNMKLDNVDFDELVELTEGLSGADLKAIVTEAGMNVIRRKGKLVTVEDFKKAYDKMIIKEKKDEVTGMFV